MTSATVVGNLTRDMELRYTQSGMAIGAFTVASFRRVKRGQDWEDEVSYIDCTLFGKRAEGLQQYLRKGTQVSVIGELVQERWKAQDGTNRSTLKINVERITLGQRNSITSGEERRGGAGYADESNVVPPELFDGDDIPF